MPCIQLVCMQVASKIISTLNNIYSFTVNRECSTGQEFHTCSWSFPLVAHHFSKVNNIAGNTTKLFLLTVGKLFNVKLFPCTIFPFMVIMWKNDSSSLIFMRGLTLDFLAQDLEYWIDFLIPDLISLIPGNPFHIIHREIQDWFLISQSWQPCT